MQQLDTYGDLPDGNLHGILNGVPIVIPKYKRRKVSAVRDFPPGCGTNALGINMRTNVAPTTVSNTEKSVSLSVSGAVFQTVSVIEPEIAARSSISDMLKISDNAEALNASNDLKATKEPIIDGKKLVNEVKNGSVLETASVRSNEIAASLLLPEMVNNPNDMDLLKPSSDLEKAMPAMNCKRPLCEVIRGAVLETDHVKLTETSGSISLPKIVSNSDNAEVLMPSSDLKFNVKPVTSVALMERIEEMNLRPVGNEPSEFDNVRVINQSEVSEFEDSDSLKEKTNVSFPGEVVPNNGSAPLSPSTRIVTNAIIFEKNVTRKYPLRRSISAVRDFPPLCGRNVPLLSEEERRKELASLNCKNICEENAEPKIQGERDGTRAISSETKKDLVGDLRKNAEAPHEAILTNPVMKCHTSCVGNVVEIEGRGRETGNVIMVSDREVVCEEGELGKEIVPYEGEMGGLGVKVGKDIVVYESEVGMLEKEVEEDIVVDRPEMVIVHGLMAGPNCPWKQGKVVKHSPARGMQGIEGKKQLFAGKGKSKSAFKTKKKRHSEDLGGSSCRRNSFPTENTDSRVMVQTGLDEDSEQDEDMEDYHVSYSQPPVVLTLLPVVPSWLKEQAHDKDAAVARKKVRDTLRLYQLLCRKLLQEEEAKSKHGGNTIKRIDLTAAKAFKGKHINGGKQILGVVPGVEVGDEFHYRMELNIVGLHRQVQAGIDYLKQGNKVIATSVVASGGYADDTENSDVLVYSGSGGNASGDKEAKDQKLERGNLALKNSIDEETPVRVIRGFKEAKVSDSDSRTKLVTTYIYDGLYLVRKYWQEPGPHGKLVFMFRLERIPGQPELAWNVVKKSKKTKVREGICDKDVSRGKEVIPIFAVNTIDNERPPPFTYITRMMYPEWCRPLPLEGCSCSSGCTSESRRCCCAARNGGEIPYNFNGAIVEAKPLVYECGPSCNCPSSCPNRVSQHGIKFQLEIFKTESRGWGVRSLNSISSGSFICEYLGELLEDRVAEQRIGNDEYLFDIGQNYSDQNLWDGLSDLMPNSAAGSYEVLEGDGFTIDAEKYGNVGRFINHSCSPNLYAQNVLYDHEDIRIPHIMFFAAENIPPLQELTYHYNYIIDEVRDSNGNIKRKDCHCESTECTGRMY